MNLIAAKPEETKFYTHVKFDIIGDCKWLK